MQTDRKQDRPKSGQKAEITECVNEIVPCAYDKDGICILSDCPCQAAVAGGMVCSSFRRRS